MRRDAFEGTRGERTVGALLVVAALGGIALTVTYWLGGQPQLEGLSLAVALLALGLALALWSRHLLPQEVRAEERPPLDEGDEAADALSEELARGEAITRRPFLVRLVVVAGATLAAAAVAPIRSLGPRPTKGAPPTAWEGGRRAVNEDGEPIDASSVPLGGLVTIFPEGAVGDPLAPAVLVRVPAEALDLPDGRAGWAPGGLIAYSKVCTHAGCPVGLYQAESRTLLCPCHQSEFDVLQGAEPLTGPAAWPLPQLPIEIGEDGVLRSTGDFSAPVGPGWWAVDDS
ncbi:MAG TPA: Rieske (2Fe-2S) protein [Aquihabitans sp.]|nr:Rieske (2Fe-2S) protein [Aquihabitans sp.]